MEAQKACIKLDTFIYLNISFCAFSFFNCDDSAVPNLFYCISYKISNLFVYSINYRLFVHRNALRHKLLGEEQSVQRFYCVPFGRT